MSTSCFTHRVILPFFGVRNLTPAASRSVFTAQAVALAFVKSVSPYTVLHVIPTTVPYSPGYTTSAVALINLLAMLELANSLSSSSQSVETDRVASRSSMLSLAGSILHSTILFFLVFSRSRVLPL